MFSERSNRQVFDPKQTRCTAMLLSMSAAPQLHPHRERSSGLPDGVDENEGRQEYESQDPVITIIRTKIIEQKVSGAEEEDGEDGGEDCVAKGALRSWCGVPHQWEINPTDFQHQACANATRHSQRFFDARACLL